MCSINGIYMAACVRCLQMMRGLEGSKINMHYNNYSDEVGLARVAPALTTDSAGDYHPKTVVHQILQKHTACYSLIYNPCNSRDASIRVSPQASIVARKLQTSPGSGTLLTKIEAVRPVPDTGSGMAGSEGARGWQEIG